ncbi:MULTISPECIES: hypothetical protein [unclassified Nocardiopsis]|uniref:hypothetical protein n=1 Tax=Nocardiopsis TaxID=2013 RepID=UPI00387AFFFB
MNAFLLHAVRTSSTPGAAPAFPTLAVHRFDRDLPDGDSLYRWMIDELSRGFELGLYSGVHVELGPDGDEGCCFREEMLLWSGAAVLNRSTGVFSIESA